MKNNRFKYLKLAVICLAAFIIWNFMCSVVDDVFNGVFMDWFTENYMVERYTTDFYGNNVLMWEPAWGQIKSLIFNTTVVVVVLSAGIIYVVSSVKIKTKNKETISEISGMLHDYMTGDKEATAVFPKEYAEISAQMAEIKSTIQHHEQVLKEEAARKNDLITYLAHDLKTPLTSVIGYMSLLDEIEDMPKEQQKKYIHITLDKARRLESLINEFFDITRYNLQHIEVEKETIDLKYMFVQMTDEFYPVLKAHGNTAELNIDDDMTVYGDSDKLARVFNNILKNAIAYSYADTPIKIWAKQTEDAVEIYIQNKGKTIPKQKLDSIFEKFFRLDEARRTNTGGAGLGLAIAKEIVTLHGGEISAVSENEETTFCVSLPLKN